MKVEEKLCHEKRSVVENKMSHPEFIRANQVTQSEIIVEKERCQIENIVEVDSSHVQGVKVEEEKSHAEIILEDERCNGCRKFQDEIGNRLNLNVCTDCCQVKFCSDRCKSDNSSAHKIDCRKAKIKILSGRLEELDCELRNCLTFGHPPENYFETKIGQFGWLVETWDYFQTRKELAEEHFQNGSEENSEESYKAALIHYLELIRLSKGDPFGFRFKIPFILLSLNRDQEAQDFIKWWLTVEPECDRANPPPSKEGDWIYLKNQNILEDLSSFITQGSRDQNFAAALALIKARIVTNFIQGLTNWKVFNECLEVGDETSTRLLSTDLAMENIEKFVYPCDDDELREQGRHLRRYLRKIARYILRGIVAEPYGYRPFPADQISTYDSFFKDSESLFQSNELAKKEICKILYGTGRIRKKKKSRETEKVE